MQIGNRKELDAARNALRDQFDAVWMGCETIGDKERRALHCALALDRPNYHHNRGNWIIFPGGRLTGWSNRILYA